MSYSLLKIYNEAQLKYHMKLIAGLKGLNRMVTWVHIVEDKEIAEFIHGDELVVTTGIVYQSNEWLLDVIHSLSKKRASGLIINIGPHIKEVCEEAIRLADEMSFPLFTIPWEIKLVDVTRHFARKILDNEQKEVSIATAMKNAIFFPEIQEPYVQQLRQYAYSTKGPYQVMTIQMGDKENRACFIPEEIKSRWKQILYFQNEKNVIFMKDHTFIVIFYQAEAEEIKKAITKMQQEVDAKEQSFHAGLGSISFKISLIQQSYKRAKATMNLTDSKNQDILFYDDLGSYKLLIDHKKDETQKQYLKEVLGPLIDHDKKHNTDYVEILDIYLKKDGSVQEVAQELFCHRNTVNYKIQKIKEILPVDLNTIEGKAQLVFAFQIFALMCRSTNY